MANRAAVAFLAISITALTVMGVDYLLGYLGTDVLLDFYPWGQVSLSRLLRNTIIFTFTMVGWLIMLFALILGIFQLRKEELW
jgi:uncharacterized integral membrane protein